MSSKNAWVVAVALTAPGLASADVANGSFESSYQGWTLTKQAQSGDFATAAVVRSGQMVDLGGSLLDYIDHQTVANYSSGLPLQAQPTDGSWQALLLQNGPSTTRLSQVVALPEHPQLTFDVAYHNWDASFSSTQMFRVQLLDADTSDVLATVFETKNSGGGVIEMSHQTFDLEAFANMNVRLQFEVIAQKNFLDVQLDNVHVVSIASEPGTHECASCAPGVTDPDQPLATDDDLTGGCSAGGSGSTAFAALALLALRRRRR
jgi:uncharacterized protein (TIGR03382 family)